MREWLDEFYGSATVRRALLAAFGPLFRKYGAGIWQAEGGVGDPPAAFIEGLAASYVSHHIDSSRIQLQEVIADAKDPRAAIQGRITEWIEKRPAKVAANETIRTSNALAVEQMRSSGVTRKVWAASAKACPYCKGLSGRTVEIERDFFSPGDEYNPEGAERSLTFTSSIGHPPVHQGCDCSVVPG